MSKVIRPLDVAVMRFYRMYVEVDSEATSEEIRKVATQKILDEQGECLMPDPDINIEEDDIAHMRIDYDYEEEVEDDD